MARWLMAPAGFEPVEGTNFTFQTSPAGEWDGVIRCQVLEVVENRRLAFAWKGGHEGNRGYGSPLDTVVTWTLSPAEGGTRIRMVHSGFELPEERERLLQHERGLEEGRAEHGRNRRPARLVELRPSPRPGAAWPGEGEQLGVPLPKSVQLARPLPGKGMARPNAGARPFAIRRLRMNPIADTAAYTGGCACGAIRYAIAAEPIFQNHRQCLDCQHMSGTGHGSYLSFAGRAAVTLTGAATHWDMVGDSGNVKTRGFCSACGSPVYLTFAAMPDLFTIHAASLDDPGRCQPQVVTYAARGHAWDRLDPALPAFATMPPK